MKQMDILRSAKVGIAGGSHAELRAKTRMELARALVGILEDQFLSVRIALERLQWIRQLVVEKAGHLEHFFGAVQVVGYSETLGQWVSGRHVEHDSLDAG